MSQQVDSGRMDQKRIVAIAVDGSDNSKEAYKYYLSNIRIEGDALYLLYCVELNNVLHAPNWYSSLFTYNEQLLQTLIEEERERIKQRLETFATWLKEDGIKGTVRSVNAESPGPGIVTTAEEIDASLIITGTRGHGMLRRTLLGSVSDYVIRHAHVPVMVCGPKSDK